MAVHARAEQRSATQSSISHSSRVPMASVAPHSAQLGALQACADASPQVRALAQLRDAQAQLAPSKPAPSRHDGLPAQLKAGVEALSGLSMDLVRVHYGSSKPAQFKALAYAQGADIHLAPGQEKHLPHEAWHVVQQAQGRVKPTRQLKGHTLINDDAGLEREADVMGARAAQFKSGGAPITRAPAPMGRTPVWQGKLEFGADFEAHHLSAFYTADSAAGFYRARKQVNSIIHRSDLDTEAKAIQNEAPAAGAYNFQVTPPVNVLKADLSAADPQKIQVTEHNTPTLMGYKTGATYKISHLHSSGAQTNNLGTRWLDLAYGKAHETRTLTIQVVGDKKQQAARLTEIDGALALHGSLAARSSQRGKMTLTYAADGTALSEYNQLATWLVNTGTYKKTCTLTADYTKKLGG